MRIGKEVGLAVEERTALYYALLLKDAGCSSNAARLARSSAPTISRSSDAQDDRLAPGRRPAARAAHGSTAGSPARPKRRRRRARDDRAALRARRRHRAKARARGDDRVGDPQPRRALGRRRLPARDRRRRDPAPRAHPQHRADRRGILQRRRRRRGAATSRPSAAAPGSTRARRQRCARAPRPQILGDAQRPRAAPRDRRLRAGGPRAARPTTRSSTRSPRRSPRSSTPSRRTPASIPGASPATR